MSPTRMVLILVAALVCVSALTVAQVGPPGPAIRPMPGRGPAPKDESAGQPAWGQAEIVFAGTLRQVQAGPVARSMPPIYNHTLTFQVTKVLRGSLKAGQEVACFHSARQMDRPTFPEGKTCVVAAKNAQGRLQALAVEPADEQKILDVMTMTSLPLGWTYKSGQAAEVISPWAPLGRSAWAAQSAPKAAAGLTCAKTGRPALLAGEGVTLTVEPVPPKQEVKWTNPDGDGEYKLTVTNTTDQAVDVPALLSDPAGKVLWEQSLVILCQGKVYACPGFVGVTGKVVATRLEPKASVSTVVNALRLEGPDWPQGGYRIEFQFCLGEKSQTKSFYYMTRHHGPIRERLKEAAKSS